MITISQGQALLSAWGHYAEPSELAILKAPAAFMAGSTVDLSATRSPGGVGLVLNDGTILLLDEPRGIIPPLTLVTVWSEPEEGSTIPNNLKYVTIHATYRTKRGKVLTAKVDVPVAVPSLMRFVFPTEPLVAEGKYDDLQSTWFDGTKAGFRGKFAPDAILAVYWIDSNGDLVAVQQVNGNENLYLHIPFTASGPPVAYIMGESTTFRAITRYRELTATSEETGQPILPEGEEIELENSSGLLWAEYTINGITLRAETYFNTNPVVSWGYFNMPVTYVGIEDVTFDIREHSRIVYKDGTVVIGQDGPDDLWLPVWFRYKVVGGWWEDAFTTSARFADGLTGTIRQYCFYTYRDNNYIAKVSNKRRYTCSAGVITWTDEAP